MQSTALQVLRQHQETSMKILKKGLAVALVVSALAITSIA
jgi:hypothetical protein